MTIAQGFTREDSELGTDAYTSSSGAEVQGQSG